MDVSSVLPRRNFFYKNIFLPCWGSKPGLCTGFAKGRCGIADPHSALHWRAFMLVHDKLCYSNRSGKGSPRVWESDIAMVWYNELHLDPIRVFGGLNVGTQTEFRSSTTYNWRKTGCTRPLRACRPSAWLHLQVSLWPPPPWSDFDQIISLHYMESMKGCSHTLSCLLPRLLCYKSYCDILERSPTLSPENFLSVHKVDIALTFTCKRDQQIIH